MIAIEPTDVLAELVRIAPDIDPDSVDPAQPLADQVDIDSMDFHNLIVALTTRYHVDIPDAVAGRLRTVTAIVEYIRGCAPSG
jgi:acyl carrier protein